MPPLTHYVKSQKVKIMNACEQIQIAKMNLRPGRGRDLKTKTDMALKEMRKERNSILCPYVVEVWHWSVGVVDRILCITLREARFQQLRAKVLHKDCEATVFDSKTMVALF